MRQTTRPFTSLVEKLNSQMLRIKSSLWCENDLNSGHQSSALTTQALSLLSVSCSSSPNPKSQLVRYPYRETMRNNDKQWCVTVFLQPVRKRLMSSFYVTAPLALWLTPPPSLPNHISYISKPNNALILLFLLNIMIIIIFLGNPKQPFSRKTFPKILLKPWIIVSCIYSIVVLAYASVTYMMMMMIITVLSLLLLFLLLYITITVIIIIVIIIIIIIIAEFSSGC